MKAETILAGPLKRVSLDEPPVEQIYETLRTAILSLELIPGARISEADIARAVGASRTPVRAALARLSEDGLIETRPSRGNYVTRLSAAAVRDAHFIRDALESTTVAQLARHGLSAAAIDRLEKNLADAAAAAERDEPDLFGRLDDEFHRLLAESTGHSRLVHLLEREKAGLGRLRALCSKESDYMQTILEEHTGIVDAIRVHDEELARKRLSTHIGRVLMLLEDLQNRNRDFFMDPNR